MCTTRFQCAACGTDGAGAPLYLVRRQVLCRECRARALEREPWHHPTSWAAPTPQKRAGYYELVRSDGTIVATVWARSQADARAYFRRQLGRRRLPGAVRKRDDNGV